MSYLKLSQISSYKIGDVKYNVRNVINNIVKTM